MLKRIIALTSALIIALSFPATAYGCNEEQTENYVSQILFGDNSSKYASSDKGKALISAMYLCCEQSDGSGENELNYLKAQKVSGLPSIDKIDVKRAALYDCSHRHWEYTSITNSKLQQQRKKVLQNTVNKVFGFGFLNKNKKISNSFSAMMYYSHILSDYLADDPFSSEITIKDQSITSYSGQPYVELNGNKPYFTAKEKKMAFEYSSFSQLDSLGRCGVNFMNISYENMPPSGSRKNISGIKPIGFSFDKYPGLVNTTPPYLYNRCHLIAHGLAGNIDTINSKTNLVTGTRYMNETGMLPFEESVMNYIREKRNHVLYRATPIYKGENLIPSGVQLEAYSVEDSGKGICFNVYCYNVQPGIIIDYGTGKSKIADITFENNDVIPFAVCEPSDDNPDLIYSMNKHLEILFSSSKNINTYSSMKDEINLIAINARQVVGSNDKSAYTKLKYYEYRYFDTLKRYVPLLLQKEKYFDEAFQ